MTVLNEAFVVVEKCHIFHIHATSYLFVLQQIFTLKQMISKTKTDDFKNQLHLNLVNSGVEQFL